MIKHISPLAITLFTGLAITFIGCESGTENEINEQTEWTQITSDEDVRSILPEISNWSRWGVDDQKGTLNYITPDKILQASQLIKSGNTVSLARQTNVATTPGVREGSYDMQKGGYGSRDFVGAVWHGFAVTHLDGLAHVFADTLQMYNGYSVDSLKLNGARILGLENFSNGIISRGVLIDVPNYLDRELEAGFTILPSLLDEIIVSQGTVITSGDIVFVRTGLGERNNRESRAGLHPSCVVWVQNKQIALLGSDGDNDAHPVEGFDRFASTFHTVGIPYLGLPLIDNADLEALSLQCRNAGRYEFFISINPWKLEGTTSCPINPIAIF